MVNSVNEISGGSNSNMHSPLSVARVLGVRERSGLTAPATHTRLDTPCEQGCGRGRFGQTWRPRELHPLGTEGVKWGIEPWGWASQ